jgi:hypothetical protein
MPAQPVLGEGGITFPDRVQDAAVDLAGLVWGRARRGGLSVHRTDPFGEITDDLQEQAENRVGAQFGQLGMISPTRRAAA